MGAEDFQMKSTQRLLSLFEKVSGEEYFLPSLKKEIPIKRKLETRFHTLLNRRPVSLKAQLTSELMDLQLPLLSGHLLKQNKTLCQMASSQEPLKLLPHGRCDCCRTLPTTAHTQAWWVERLSSRLQQEGISTKRGLRGQLSLWHELAHQENGGATSQDGGNTQLSTTGHGTCPFSLQDQLLHHLNHLTWPLRQD